MARIKIRDTDIINGIMMPYVKDEANRYKVRQYALKGTYSPGQLIYMLQTLKAGMDGYRQEKADK